MKKILALFLVVIMSFGSTVTAYANNNTDIKGDKEKQDKAQVYYINQNGKKEKSNLTVDFFKDLTNIGQAKLPSDNDAGTITPTIVPPPDDGSAIRITSIVRKSFTNEDVNAVIDIGIGTVFGYSWSKLGGYLIKLGIGTAILQSEWLNNFASTAVGTVLSHALDFAHASPTYVELYQYKVWSDYYDCYIVYETAIYYSDLSYSDPIEVQYFDVRYDRGAGSTI